MVDREDLTNAIALNSTLFNAATIIGPAIGGAVYAWVGPGWCFAINGLSYLAVIGGLLMMRLAPVARPAARRAVHTELREGFAWLREDRAARALVAILGVSSLVGVGLVTLMPAWAVNILHGDVKTNGLLLSTRGLGALAGALMMAALARRARRGQLMFAGAFLLPLALVAFAASRSLSLSLMALVAVGWTFMIIVNTTNTLAQTRVPDALRGRVMSMFTLVFFGGMPLGSLAAGEAAHRFGEPGTVIGGAALLLLAAAFFRLRWPHLADLR